MSRKLTKEQIEYFREKLVDKGRPVRFLNEKGQNVNLSTGETLPKGTLVIHQFVYWNMTEETAKEIAELLELKPIFSMED